LILMLVHDTWFVFSTILFTLLILSRSCSDLAKTKLIKLERLYARNKVTGDMLDGYRHLVFSSVHDLGKSQVVVYAVLCLCSLVLRSLPIRLTLTFLSFLKSTPWSLCYLHKYTTSSH
jgi:hypothetical protein